MITNFPAVQIINDIPCVSSLNIAQHFEKPHDAVLKTIRRIASECPSNFTGVNFYGSEYSDSTGRSLPMYYLSRDGFTLVAMGFTGAKALAWKLKYIEAFNKMAEVLITPQPSIETTHTQRRRTQPKAKYRDFLPLPFPTLKQKEDELEAHFASIKEHINAIFEHETEAYAIVRELMLPAQRNFDAKRSTIIKLHNGMENLWYALDHSLKGVQDQVQTMLMVTGI